MTYRPRLVAQLLIAPTDVVEELRSMSNVVGQLEVIDRSLILAFLVSLARRMLKLNADQSI